MAFGALWPSLQPHLDVPVQTRAAGLRQAQQLEPTAARRVLSTPGGKHVVRSGMAKPASHLPTTQTRSPIHQSAKGFRSWLLHIVAKLVEGDGGSRFLDAWRPEINCLGRLAGPGLEMGVHRAWRLRAEAGHTEGIPNGLVRLRELSIHSSMVSHVTSSTTPKEFPMISRSPITPGGNA